MQTCYSLDTNAWHVTALSLQGLLPCSVTSTEIVDAIFQQTGRQLDKRDVELPEITHLGTYQASIRRHPEVNGVFNVVVQREKNS